VRANAWARGDVEAIRKLPATDQRGACEAAVRNASFMKKLGADNAVAQMEATWLNAAESALKNNAVSIAVLPIQQIVSTDGYVAKLRARGYAVTEPDAGTD
jgi:hypothetical protein